MSDTEGSAFINEQQIGTKQFRRSYRCRFASV